MMTRGWTIVSSQTERRHDPSLRRILLERSLSHFRSECRGDPGGHRFSAGMRFAYLMIRAICRCHGLLGDTSKGDVGAGRFASVCWVSCLRASRPLFRRGTEALPRLNSRDHRALDFSMLLFGRGARKKAGALGAGPLGLKSVARVSMDPGLTAHLSAIWMSGVVDPRPSRTTALVGEMT
jgi:hypothetical protein